jgi:hypothetical protein
MISQRKRCLILVAVGAAAVALAFGDLSASAAEKKSAAQKKVTFDQAWARCKAELDKEGTASNMTTNDRYIRGGACMMKYGYRL